MGGGDQEGKTSTGGEEAGGNGEDVGEALDSAEGNNVEGRQWQSFSADVLYIDIR